jgi:hypothetical protein
MSLKTIHECKCTDCQNRTDPDKQQLHHQMNLMMSRLDEQQRRWYAAIEAQRNGHGGTHLVHQITGLDVKTIRRGISEISHELRQRPSQRVRLSGAGRPSVVKKSQV